MVIDKIAWLCPICGEFHLVDFCTEEKTIQHKGITVIYESQFYKCNNTTSEENCFMPGKLLNENLKRIRESSLKQ